MIEIGGRPILWHIMKIFAHHGYREFIVCLGYKGYMIKEYFANFFLHQSDVTIDTIENKITFHQTSSEPWRVTLVDTGEQTYIGGRLKRVKGYLDRNAPFCFTYGDGLSDIDINALVAFHRSANRLATVTAVLPPGRYGSLDLEADRVARFAEKPPSGDGFINGGFFVLNPAVIDRIEGDQTSWEGRTLGELAAEIPMLGISAQRLLARYGHAARQELFGGTLADQPQPVESLELAPLWSAWIWSSGAANASC